MFSIDSSCNILISFFTISLSSGLHIIISRCSVTLVIDKFGCASMFLPSKLINELQCLSLIIFAIFQSAFLFIISFQSAFLPYLFTISLSLPLHDVTVSKRFNASLTDKFECSSIFLTDLKLLIAIIIYMVHHYYYSALTWPVSRLSQFSFSNENLHRHVPAD